MRKQMVVWSRVLSVLMFLVSLLLALDGHGGMAELTFGVSLLLRLGGFLYLGSGLEERRPRPLWELTLGIAGLMLLHGVYIGLSDGSWADLSAAIVASLVLIGVLGASGYKRRIADARMARRLANEAKLRDPDYVL